MSMRMLQSIEKNITHLQLHNMVLYWAENDVTTIKWDPTGKYYKQAYDFQFTEQTSDTSSANCSAE
jgi:hypothetical protein